MLLIAGCVLQEKGPTHVTLIITLHAQKIRGLSHTIHWRQSEMSNHCLPQDIPTVQSLYEAWKEGKVMGRNWAQLSRTETETAKFVCLILSTPPCSSTLCGLIGQWQLLKDHAGMYNNRWSRTLQLPAFICL